MEAADDLTTGKHIKKSLQIVSGELQAIMLPENLRASFTLLRKWFMKNKKPNILYYFFSLGMQQRN